MRDTDTVLGCLRTVFKTMSETVLKLDAYIRYCMHAHSFKAALIAFLVTGFN